MIDAIIESLELKDEKRSGQQLYSIEDPDSVAGHSWSVALLTLIYGTGEGINMEKALKLAVIHDLAESKTGDIAARADEEKQEKSEEEKEAMEHDAITELSEELNTHEIRMLWKEYHRAESPEAKLVKDMDMIERSVTALKNEEEGNYDPENNQEMPEENMDEFLMTCEGNFQTEIGQKLFEKIQKRYKEVKND